MGDHRAHLVALKATEADRTWPIVVRRAQAADRDAVLAFATRTWDGWDYIPHAWPVWLAADDGVLLVATVGAPAGGGPARDAEGEVLSVGQPIAISRVALLSPVEGWVEGIRVDPRVRGLGVATDLQVAELHWLAAHRPQITRYATGARNEGSHRLGARHGFELLARYVSWTWKDPTKPADDERDETGFDEPTRQDANRRRRDLLGRLEADGLVLARPTPPPGGAAWRTRRGSSPVSGCTSAVAWTMQELGQESFSAHVAAARSSPSKARAGGLPSSAARSSRPKTPASISP